MVEIFPDLATAPLAKIPLAAFPREMAAGK
jgi:hypothetical protein